MLLDFESQPLWLNIFYFCCAGAVTWIAGTRIAQYVDAISDKTGIGHAFAGMLILGAVTSFPEIGAVGTSAAYGDADLAINNILGSLAINVVLLAVGDIVARRYALTGVVAEPATLFQATLGILALAVLAIGLAAGDAPVFRVGGWTLGLFAMAVLSFWISSRYAERSPWRIDRSVKKDARKDKPPAADRSDLEKQPLAALIARTAVAGATVLLAGYILSRTGDAIAAQSGMGNNFAGMILVGFASSLPELSTIIAAVRLRRAEMAIGDVLGTNIFNLAILLVADVFYGGGPILNEAGEFEIIGTLLSLILTAIYLLGLLERRDRTIGGVGYDSIAVIIVYLLGLGVLYRVS
jgi:cation:H+ antiporter